MATNCIPSGVSSSMFLTAWMVILYQLAVTLAEDKLFKATTVSASILSQYYSQAIGGMSMLNCAALSNTRPWSRLICYQGTTCYLVDYLTKPDSNREVADAGSLMCFTDVPEMACIFNQNLYKQGDIVPYLCAMHCCDNGEMQDCAIVNNNPCPESFTYVPQLGCTYISGDTYNYQDGAKTACASLSGSRLVMGGDFSWLRTLLYECQPSGYFWVGIEGSKWLDGSTVDAPVWKTGEPDQSALCGVVLYFDNYFAIEANCANVPETNYICQIP